MKALEPSVSYAAMGTKPPAEQSTAKLFLALWPDAAARRVLCLARDAWPWPAGARLVPAEKLHATIHFLGRVPAERVAALGDRLAVDFFPFEMAFPHARKWRRGLVVAAPDPVPAGYRELHARLGDALRGCGLDCDPRPPLPHITLARRAGAAKPPRGGNAMDEFLRGARWIVADYTLVQTAAAGNYRILHRYCAS